ncbi:MAG: hypothetical protein QOJ50_2894 [Cryptosporangiaceae bacterium]|jgi:hypothetical protein|nr:hypothetical protein [Cryptosporangiaceae bacterium]
MTRPRRRPRHIPKGDTPVPGETITPPILSPVSSSYLTHSLLHLSWRLQPRDLTLALLLDEHRTLTTGQITTVLFSSPRTCRNRLDALRGLRFIDRVLLNRPGQPLSAHWVPGPLSARYAALARDERPPTARALWERQDSIMTTDKLGHLVGANQFFIDLLARARTHPGARLLRWWSARSAAAGHGGLIHPDGHGIWREGGSTAGFYLEHDTGTETHRRLAGKLEQYRSIQSRGGPSYPVLFWLPSTARENNLHRHLAGLTAGVTVATAARDAANGAGPAGAVWRLAGNGRHRLRLSELPSRPGKPDTGYDPGPATPDQDPLRLLLPDRTS